MLAGIEKSLEPALAAVVVPYLGTDLVSAKVPVEIQERNQHLEVSVTLGFPAAGYADQLADEIATSIQHVTQVTKVDVKIHSKVASHSVQGTLSPVPGVKNIIAVASGKGGVGKSTVAVNLALALQAEGGRVGMLDADIYGPSQPRMLGVSGARPRSRDGKSFEPIEAHGLQMISIGSLVDEETPTVWRGPMVTQALTQLIFQTRWRDIDYLIVDMPPGTGDIQLTLSQRVPVSGVIIVTTPQDIALLDAQKGLEMFRKVNVEVLGIVENMSTFVCPDCGHVTPLFGEGGGERMAAERGVPLLGRVPLDIRLRRETDEGEPSVIRETSQDLAREFREIARYAAGRLSLRPREYKGAFPKIVVEEKK
jgi:ATP-binding protein involved in chromosome partitioning